jgi:hypothetical protein
MFIPDPGSNSNTKEEGNNKIAVLLFFIAINFTKLRIIIFLAGVETDLS